jgi:gas vesicle protein
MNSYSQEQRGYGFVIGLLTGTLVGAGLAMWLAPGSVAEIRERVTDTARTIGKKASERYQQAGARLGDSLDDLTRKGNEVRDEVAGSVARGAREVERFAVAAKSEAGKARS